MLHSVTTSTSSPTTRVLLIDDSELVRRGIRDALQASPDNHIKVIGEGATIQSGRQLCAELQPDVALLDIRLPDGSGLDLIAELKRVSPKTRIIILTSHQHDSYIHAALKAGVHGYFLKEIEPAGLVRAIHDAMEGKSTLDPVASARIANIIRNKTSFDNLGGPLNNLSAQERRVLALVAKGQTNKEIAVTLNLSSNTVKNYMGSVFQKLDVSRRSQAAALYVKAHPSE